MREIHVDQIISTVKRLSQEANYDLGEDVLEALKAGVEKEESPAGRAVLEQIVENARLAREDRVPMCQDTGVTVVFLEVGQDVHVVGGALYDAVHEGVRQGYREGYLRSSMVGDPFGRENTGDNTPAMIHTEIVPGDRLKMIVTPKGAGSENMSALRMLKPADGAEGVKKFILEVVAGAGPNACPPIIAGVGVGGNFEKCAYLAKRALLREIGQHNPDPEIAAMEKELLERVNDLGIGPQGMGGRVTGLWVAIEAAPCHIASLPVAVNIQCHAARHREAVL